MGNFRPAHSLLAVPFLGLALLAEPGPRLEVVGGSLDDQAFARAAAGLSPDGLLPQGGLPLALEAIRATDRFRRVEAAGNQVVLDPWPPMAALVWTGDAPSRLRKTLVQGVRAGARVGNLRLETLRVLAQERMVAAGYPAARIRASRRDGDATLVLDVAAGPPNLVTGVEVVGKLGPFRPEELIRWSEAAPGRTLWTREFELDCIRRLRTRFQKAKRFEGRVDLDWDSGGLLRITVDVGPRVKLKSEGGGLGWTSLKDMVPLARADRYSSELLDEGERRILRLLRSHGHLGAQVSYRREVVATGPEGPEEVVVTYTLDPGPVAKIGAISFEGNAAVGEAELRRATGNGRSFLLRSRARPEAMDAIEDRIQALYQDKGFTEVKLRRQVNLKGDRADLVFRIQEGRPRLISWVRLELPAGGFGDPWGLGESLALIFSDQAVLRSTTPTTRVYASDRPEMAGGEGTLDRADGEEGCRLTFILARPIPLLKADFFRVYTAIRQRHLVSLGLVRPVVRSQVVDEGGLAGILIQVPDQPAEKVRRLVVQGSDKTRARAVLRELPVKPGEPLDQDKLSKAQGGLGGLQAFNRVDIGSLADLPAEPGPPSPWKAGDLLVHTEERSPWVATHSFGYDRTQGYYFGNGIQRLNVGGMGRTLDLNARTGNGTLDNPTLRNLFKTGQYTESLDSYSLAYTDPWFTPDWPSLPDHTALRMEGAYIQEQRYIYGVHRRRFTSSLRWPVSPSVSIETGYRFERVEVASDVDGINADVLSTIARYPGRAIISAPYVQVVRDTRDNAFDPTSGTYSLARFEAATQLFLTSPNSSFVKLDLRNQWTWPIGHKASAGVVALGLRVGIAKPTAASAEDLPLSERFFAGGTGSMRGVQPDFLGPLGQVPIYSLVNNNSVPEVQGNQVIPLGGQALVIANLEYRFPISQTVWGEVFLDSGQVYQKPFNSWYDYQAGPTLTPVPTHLPIRSALGIGLIFKLGIPLKLEYAQDFNRLLKRPTSANEQYTDLKNILISAGFQF